MVPVVVRLCVLALSLRFAHAGMFWGSGPPGDLSSPVAVLNEENFDEAIIDSEDRIWLLDFYAPWCQHCKKLAPVYHEAALKVKGLRFAMIDATANTGLAKRYNVSGYPTIQWMRNGHVRRYRGAHNVEAWEALSRKLHQSPTPTISSLAQYQEQLRSHDVSFLVGAKNARSEEEKKMVEVFTKVAQRFQDTMLFSQTDDPEVMKALKKPDSFFICKLHGQGNENPIFLKMKDVNAAVSSAISKLENADEDQIAVVGTNIRTEFLHNWINAQRFPLVTMLGPKNFYDTLHGGRALVTAVVNGAEKTVEKYRNALLVLARPNSPLKKQVREQFFFGLLVRPTNKQRATDPGKEKEVEMLDKFLADYDIKGTDLPRVIVFDEDKKRYFYEDVSESEEIKKFVNDVADGLILPQWEGAWGKPNKIWRIVKSLFPFLSSLDFLPPFSFVIPLCLFALYLFIKLLCMDVGDEDDEDTLAQKEVKQD